MKFNFLIAPDFPPAHFAGWHMLNTLLQRRSGLQLHLLMPANAQEQTALLQQGSVDMVYANPFDASDLIRQMHYRAVARPIGKADEMVIAAGLGPAVQIVENLKPGCRIALTDNRDVKLIGLRLLESADLAESDIEWCLRDSYQAVARAAIKGEVDAAFFLSDAYHALTRLTRSQLHVVIESALDDITHVLLAHPEIVPELPKIVAALTEIGESASDKEVLEALGLPLGFEAMIDEDAEFMIDLMDTLLD
ncbi:MAG: PhnD/SsuA/transferrin family substrate-binding protein [Casimicrobium sp.]